MFNVKIQLIPNVRPLNILQEQGNRPKSLKRNKNEE